MGKEKATKKRGRKSKKKSKDPNKPKRPMTSFMFFSQEYRKKVAEENKDLKVTEIGKKLGEMWKKVSPDEKKVFEEFSTVTLKPTKSSIEIRRNGPKS
jgi:hypothetical protein